MSDQIYGNATWDLRKSPHGSLSPSLSISSSCEEFQNRDHTVGAREPFKHKSQTRFLDWVAKSRMDDPSLTDLQLRTCPLADCHHVVETAEQMLQHVYANCLQFRQHGKYLCLNCNKTDRIGRLHMKKCPEMQRSLSCKDRIADIATRAKKMFSNRRSMHQSDPTVAHVLHEKYPSDVPCGADASPPSWELEGSDTDFPCGVDGSPPPRELEGVPSSDIVAELFNNWVSRYPVISDMEENWQTSNYAAIGEQAAELAVDGPSMPVIQDRLTSPRAELSPDNYSSTMARRSEPSELSAEETSCPLASGSQWPQPLFSSRRETLFRDDYAGYSAPVTLQRPYNPRPVASCVSPIDPSMSDQDLGHFVVSPIRSNSDDSFDLLFDKATSSAPSSIVSPMSSFDSYEAVDVVSKNNNQSWIPIQYFPEKAMFMDPESVETPETLLSDGSDFFHETMTPAMHRTNSSQLDLALWKPEIISPLVPRDLLPAPAQELSLSMVPPRITREYKCACGHEPKGVEVHKASNLKRHQKTCRRRFSPYNRTQSLYSCPEPGCPSQFTRSDNRLAHQRKQNHYGYLQLPAEIEDPEEYYAALESRRNSAPGDFAR